VDHIENITNCNCTEDDYECDWGFERTQLSGICGKVIEQVIPSPCIGEYNISQGYRTIPGDTCINHLAKFKKLTQTCPSEKEITPAPLSTTVIVIIIIATVLLTIGLLFIGMVIGSRSEWFRRIFPWIQKAPEWINITMAMDQESSGVDIEETEINHKKDNSQHDTTDFEDVF